VGTRERDMLVVDVHAGIAVDFRPSWSFLAEEVLDHYLTVLDADLHRKVRIQHFHLVGPALVHTVEGVFDMAGERSNRGSRFGILGIALDDDLAVFDVDADVGIPQLSRNATVLAGDREVEALCFGACPLRYRESLFCHWLSRRRRAPARRDPSLWPRSGSSRRGSS